MSTVNVEGTSIFNEEGVGTREVEVCYFAVTCIVSRHCGGM